MNYFDVLFSPVIIMATLIYTFMAITFELMYTRFLHRLKDTASTHWVAQHIGAPFFHVLLLVCFIYMSYPVLYGLDTQLSNGSVVPSLSQLLNAHSGQTMKLINTIFVISVILPLIPIINRFSALILPFQAMAGSAVLYGWLSEFSQISFIILPSYTVLALIIFFSAIAEFMAQTLAIFLETHIRHSYQAKAMQKIIHKSTLLILQVPILLIYTLSLN